MTNETTETTETKEIKFAPYSFSKISSFEGCPQKFKFQYIDKLKPNIEDNYHLIKGRNIHKFFELMGNSEKFQEHALKHPEEIQTVKSIFKDIKNPNHTLNPFLQAITNDHNTKKEFKIGFDYSMNPCAYSAKNCLFRGIIDLVCIVDNTLNLVDYKTGKAKEFSYQDTRQLMFYGLWFFKYRPHIEKIKINYVYVEHNQNNSIVLERKYVSDYESQLRNSITQIESATEFHKKTTFCKFCQYRDVCKDKA